MAISVAGTGRPIVPLYSRADDRIDVAIGEVSDSP